MNETVIQGFELMLFGMAGIFIVLFLIYLVCIILNRIFSVKK
ncbi:OadG-related small transporter subunit [Agrilactobacillus fermenti]|nr:OadG-related small transporter subunit [Agrilactobacillus fermenti]